MSVGCIFLVNNIMMTFNSIASIKKKHFLFQIVFKVKYPEDLLNKEFNGNLHVTIPKAVRAEDKLVNNKPKDILENVLCSGKDFTNKKQMKDEFIHGYFEGFDRRMLVVLLYLQEQLRSKDIFR